jgi:amino acid transporter
VVTVSSRALHPLAGLVGGLFILVDYYLTTALSALSGLLYLAVVAPQLKPVAVQFTVAAIALLGALNALGIKESARASAVFATLAAIGQFVVVFVVAIHLGPAGIVDSVKALGRGPAVGPATLVTGYAGAFLAFSGLESISQLAPAIKEPRQRVSREALIAVVVTIAATSPLLTLWSTTLLGSKANSDQFVSLLGASFGGPVLGDFVAMSGALLLVFASNTAIIGAYHVFIALSRMRFLPRVLQERNRLRGTPHNAILIAVAVPIVLVVAANGSTTILGDLYAFGLLGAFTLTSLSLDIVRWHERAHRPDERTPVRTAGFAVGVLTTVLVGVAWVTNLIHKPLATEFGGGLMLLGLAVGLTTYLVKNRQAPIVFPFMHRPQVPVVPASGVRRLPKCDVLVVLPHDREGQEAILAELPKVARDRRVVFLYRGSQPAEVLADLLEVNDPYLTDGAAQAAFSRAERAARDISRDRRYVYVPGNLSREAIGDVWKRVNPHETLIMDGDQDVLPPIAVDRVRRSYVDGMAVLHLMTDRRHPVGAEA